MKILAIIGSSKKGNTSEVVNYFGKQLNNNTEKIDFEYLFLKDHPIDFCTGCHNCIFIGEESCPHYSSVKTIEEKILSSDGLILATPGYMFSVTGIMKNFLDHVAYNCHRPKYFGKKAYILSVCTKLQQKSVFTPLETWALGSGFKVIGKTYVEMLSIPFVEKEINKIKININKASFLFYNALLTNHELKPDFGSIIGFYSFRTISKIISNILKQIMNILKILMLMTKKQNGMFLQKFLNFLYL